MPRCVCMHAWVCVRLCVLLFFYFGVGIVLGSWRLRLKSVGESYEFWIREGDRFYKQPAVPSRVPDVLPRRPGVISNFINQGVDSNSASLRAHHPQSQPLCSQPAETDCKEPAEPENLHHKWHPDAPPSRPAALPARPGLCNSDGGRADGPRVPMDEREEVIQEMLQAGEQLGCWRTHSAPFLCLPVAHRLRVRFGFHRVTHRSVDAGMRRGVWWLCNVCFNICLHLHFIFNRHITYFSLNAT